MGKSRPVTEFVSIEVPNDYSSLIERLVNWIKFDSRLQADKINCLNVLLDLSSRIAEYQLVDADDSQLKPSLFLDGIPLTRQAIKKIVADCPWVYSYQTLHYFLSFLGAKTVKQRPVSPTFIKRWRLDFGSRYHDLISHYGYDIVRQSSYVFEQIENFIVQNKYKGKLMNYLRQG